MTVFDCQSLAKNEKNCYNKICAITKKYRLEVKNWKTRRKNIP